MAGLDDHVRIHRARHFLVALAVAAALGAIEFFEPLDWLVWNTQPQIFDRQASGEIVYIGASDDVTDPTEPERRRELATLISGIDKAGAAKVFVDLRFQDASEAGADRTLAEAIERSGSTYLVERYRTTVTGPRMLSTIPAIARTAPRVVARERLTAFGRVWTGELGSIDEGVFRQSLAGALANAPAKVGEDFRIDYSIDHRTVPSLSMSRALSSVATPEASERFAGKLVVIGSDAEADPAERAIPGHADVPESTRAILAGETLRAGAPEDPGWIPSFAAFAALLGGLATLVRSDRSRRLGCLFLALGLAAWFFLAPQVKVTAHLSAPIGLFAIYGALRLWKAHPQSASTIGESSRMPSIRIRHFLAAAIAALTLGVTGLLAPLDWLIWASHARTVDRPASGEIVFVGGVDDLADPTRPEHRRQLATLIDGLSSAGAGKIFLDVRLEEPSERRADQTLARSIERSGRVSLVETYSTTVTGPRIISTIPSIAGTAPRVVSKQLLIPIGWTWMADHGSVDDGVFRQSFPAALADAAPKVGADFRIDYSIDHRSVPTISMPDALASISSAKGKDLFGDKFVVIGNGGVDESNYAAIPGHQRVSVSMVSILAGETLRAGPPADIGSTATFAVFLALLAATLVAARNRRTRHRGYVLVVLAVPIWFALAIYLRVTPHLSVPIAFLAIFAAIRAWNARNRAASLVDEISGLPTFRVLERDLARRPSVAPVSVVVARIHRFDEVRSILSPESLGAYVRSIADRFRIAEDKLTVYSNAGRYLAWIQEFEDEPHLEAHLKGLRAIFSQPLNVNGTAVDVGITFGADATREASPARKISSATAAADRTSEADAPVVFAQSTTVSDRLWNVSLQAKIDAALKSGEIYVVYQPQFHVQSGRLTGFEALVRWNDPERGAISPSYFIEQCEHAGRMEALTRKVIHDTIDAIQRSSFAADASRHFSINVSATLLHDSRVLDMLENALAPTTIPASRITIEITETARIADYDRARVVLSQLRQRGFRVSIDDFGVGAASFETLQRLPFDELKIDRAFVSRIADDAKARQIVEALIALCKGLGLDVIAEGVEESATLDMLKSMGCPGAQGYLLGRPDDLPTVRQCSQPEVALGA